MSSGQVFVLCIMAMVMVTSILKGGMGIGCSRRSRRKREQGEASPIQEDGLSALNARLDAVIDRLGALETIVTDEDRQLNRKFADLDDRRPRA